MAENYLNAIAEALASEGTVATASRPAAGIGSKVLLGMFGTQQPRRGLSVAYFGDCEHSSARLARIASRGLNDPGSLTHEEIKSLAGSVLTQAPNHLK